MNELHRIAPLPLALTLLFLIVSGIAVAAPEASSATASDSSVVINEVESNGDPAGDWVELANTDPSDSVDVSGWSIIDDDDSHAPVILPADTDIESGGYLAVYTEPSFGLGSNDSVTLSDADGTVVDETIWSGHAATTWGRVPDMTGDFAVTGEPTRGLRNVAEGANPGSPGDPADAWPYDPQDISPVALTDDHGGDLVSDFIAEDMSGVDFGSDGTAYVVNNDEGTLYALTPQDANSYHIDSRHQLRYEDGSGLPDAEGVTVGPDGALYVATERDNSSKDASRPSVLRFELSGGGEAGPAAGELHATDEWNLAEFTGEIGANGGLETIAWISDADDSALFAVGVEETGDVLFVALAEDEATLVQRYEAPFEGVMASDYDAATGELAILCDEACDGASQVLVTGEGGFGPADETIYARPEGMDNLANEGYARRVDAGGTERFLWTDDGATDGVGLRGAVRSAGEVPGDLPSDPTGSLGSTSSSAA
ncbi:Putative secreted protein [Corynebacterium glyciniphilum AJ 3170]|uniref:Putative secreted protein n=1 Tax=Corynebacterium glyciniphilum AJ 3170 TaxID=1404245 RepID=X5DPX7_9CORY|nr:lamin tail domain-containing protein [Corynebacterium glyciniphilum]AHW62717.1 Putative secreted protein [Corynebacterium glyciniphilum AJ 3170]